MYTHIYLYVHICMKTCWHDPIWSYMILYDPIWSYMILYDPIWSYMILYDPIWSYMILYVKIAINCVYMSRSTLYI